VIFSVYTYSKNGNRCTCVFGVLSVICFSGSTMLSIVLVFVVVLVVVAVVVVVVVVVLVIVFIQSCGRKTK